MSVVRSATLSRIALAAALACAFAPAGAIDLSQAYRAAAEHDAQIRAARAQADSRREQLPQARSQLLPQVAINSSRSRNSLDSVQPVLGRGIDGAVPGSRPPCGHQGRRLTGVGRRHRGRGADPRHARPGAAAGRDHW